MQITIWTKLVQKLLLADDKSSNLLGIALVPLEQVMIWSFRGEDNCERLGLPHLRKPKSFTCEVLKTEERFEKVYKEYIKRGVEANILMLEAIKKDYDNYMEFNDSKSGSK